MTVLVRRLPAAELDAAKGEALARLDYDNGWKQRAYGKHDPRLSQGLRAVMAPVLLERYRAALEAIVVELRTPAPPPPPPPAAAPKHPKPSRARPVRGEPVRATPEDFVVSLSDRDIAARRRKALEALAAIEAGEA